MFLSNRLSHMFVCVCAFLLAYSGISVLTSIGAGLCNQTTGTSCVYDLPAPNDTIKCQANGTQYTVNGCTMVADAIADSSQCGDYIIIATGEQYIFQGNVLQCGSYKAKACDTRVCPGSY
jgi:hypothetical protein